jgi:hypothetical protein
VGVQELQNELVAGKTLVFPDFAGHPHENEPGPHKTQQQGQQQPAVPVP